MIRKKFIDAYQSSLKYLAVRDRSKQEIIQYLEKKGFPNKDIHDAVTKLEQENLINDRNFATFFVEQREKFKPKSKIALAFELRRKGVNAEIIETSLNSIDEYASALSAIQSRLKLWQGYDNEKLKKKVMSYLQYRGFSYEVCASTWVQILEYEQN